jgi:hypothetical protein
VLVRTHAKVFDSFSCVPLAAEQHGVRTGWRTKSELIEGKHFPTGLQDAFPGTLCEAKGSDRELWDLLLTDVICDGANLNDYF